MSRYDSGCTGTAVLWVMQVATNFCRDVARGQQRHVSKTQQGSMQPGSHLKRSTSSGGLLQPMTRRCIFRASSMSAATMSAVMCLLQHRTHQVCLVAAVCGSVLSLQVGGRKQCHAVVDCRGSCSRRAMCTDQQGSQQQLDLTGLADWRTQRLAAGHPRPGATPEPVSLCRRCAAA